MLDFYGLPRSGSQKHISDQDERRVDLGVALRSYFVELFKWNVESANLTDLLIASYPDRVPPTAPGIFLHFMLSVVVLCAIYAFILGIS